MIAENLEGRECKDCSNLCEVIEILQDNIMMARWGDKCGKWSNSIKENHQQLA